MICLRLNYSIRGGTLERGEALERLKLARTDLSYLLENYDSIAEGGGDSVRRYLGTVGVTSGMYGITKVLKILQNEADDIVEYTEAMDEFDSYLRQADTACYSANFVEFSAASTKPEQFLKVSALGSSNLIMRKKLYSVVFFFKPNRPMIGC